MLEEFPPSLLASGKSKLPCFSPDLIESKDYVNTIFMLQNK
jgi:hypothetical protein